MSIEIKRSGSRQQTKGPADWFTGDVQIEPLVNLEDPGRVQVGNVTFEPGARTHWHTHPLGQTLFVMSGVGLIQCQDGPVNIIRPGDVIWTPPNIKHWHGAADSEPMVHLSIVEKLNGVPVHWMEAVSQSDYEAGCSLCKQSQTTRS